MATIITAIAFFVVWLLISFVFYSVLYKQGQDNERRIGKIAQKMIDAEEAAKVSIKHDTWPVPVTTVGDTFTITSDKLLFVLVFFIKNTKTGESKQEVIFITESSKSVMELLTDRILRYKDPLLWKIVFDHTVPIKFVVPPADFELKTVPPRPESSFIHVLLYVRDVFANNAIEKSLLDNLVTRVTTKYGTDTRKKLG
jgi:hypothetical protein